LSSVIGGRRSACIGSVRAGSTPVRNVAAPYFRGLAMARHRRVKGEMGAGAAMRKRFAVEP